MPSISPGPTNQPSPAPTPDPTSLPTHQQFSSANGGEYRKTFHGFAPGYAVVIDSPSAFQITPMQIDTWNREKMDISRNDSHVPFVPGPYPKHNLAPSSGPDAIYR